jgi:hypothetical protein
MFRAAFTMPGHALVNHCILLNTNEFVVVEMSQGGAIEPVCQHEKTKG